MASKSESFHTTQTGGRPATKGVIPGRYALSVGLPDKTPPSGWKWTALSDVARLESGHTPSRRFPEYWDGEIPWIGIKDATDNHGRVIFDTYQHVTQEGINNSSARMLPAGTVCLSRTASVGFVVVMGRSMSTSQDFVNWICSEKIDNHFLKYILVSEHDSMLRFASGTTHQTIYYPEAKAFHVCLPDIREQHAIAEVLRVLDDKIELNRRMNRTLESMAQAVFRQWFVENEDSKDWETQSLEQHIEAERGLSYKGEGLSKDDGIPMHNLNSVYEGGGYKYEGIKYYTGEYKERHIVRSGDIIVTNTEQGFQYLLIGYPAIVPKHFGATGIFSHHIYRVQALSASPLKTYYLYFLLMDPLVREQIIGCTNGTTVNMLSVDGLQTPKFKLPPKELIDKFEQFAAPIFEKLELLYEECRTLASLRDTLLPKLMRGEVRVKDI